MVADKITRQLIFWGVWLIIPLIWEIVIGVISSFAVAFKHFRLKNKGVEYNPRVTILVPVFNSHKTLKSCLKSIYSQKYPREYLEVLLIDNGSSDNGYEIFTEFQAEHPNLKLWWYQSEQGKSKALNKGIFSSTGKYVINIDSDGCLDDSAIINIVTKFENNKDIICMTGVVLIDPFLIERTKGRLLKSIRICELFEYNESFLIGRNFQSMCNNIYTLAGAFSCFRREALLKTQMYNTETLGEDTHMTFQMKDFIGGKISICENAFFYVDPIESLDKLYIQRQRWQRAELEVASMFSKMHLGGPIDFMFKPTMRNLVSDHTLAFPRLIWIFAMIYLYFINYPLSLLIGANGLLYAAYVFNSFLYMFVSGFYLKGQERTKKYIFSKWYYCFLLPLYRFIIYWMRVAGIVNSMNTESRWRAMTFKEEVEQVRKSVEQDVKPKISFLFILKRWINK